MCHRSLSNRRVLPSAEVRDAVSATETEPQGEERANHVSGSECAVHNRSNWKHKYLLKAISRTLFESAHSRQILSGCVPIYPLENVQHRPFERALLLLCEWPCMCMPKYIANTGARRQQNNERGKKERKKKKQSSNKYRVHNRSGWKRENVGTHELKRDTHTQHDAVKEWNECRSRDRMWVRVASVTYSSNGSSSSSRQRAAAIQWEYTEGVALLSCSMHNEISSARDLRVWVNVCLHVCVYVCAWATDESGFLFVFRICIIRWTARRVYPEAALCIVPSSKRSIAQCVSQTRHLHSQKQCRQHHSRHISQKFWSNKFKAHEIQRKRRDFELVFVFLIFHLFVSLVQFSPCAFRRNLAATRRFIFVYLFACVSCAQISLCSFCIIVQFPLEDEVTLIFVWVSEWVMVLRRIQLNCNLFERTTGLIHSK